MGGVTGGDGWLVLEARIRERNARKGKPIKVIVETTTEEKPGKELKIITLPPLEEGGRKGRRR